MCEVDTFIIFILQIRKLRIRKVKNFVQSHTTGRRHSWAVSVFSLRSFGPPGLSKKMCSLRLRLSAVAPTPCSVSDYLGVFCVALIVPLVWLDFLGPGSPLISVPRWWRGHKVNESLRTPSPESWGLPRTSWLLALKPRGFKIPVG